MNEQTSKQTRSRIMAAVKGRNTRPEILIRKALFSRGFRYRLHVKALPGSPDVVFKKWKVVVLVDGCFWHNHGCSRSRVPKTNTDYWRIKLSRNVTRDQTNIKLLADLGWRVCRVWTCALHNQHPVEVAKLADDIALWIIQGGQFMSFGDEVSEANSHVTETF